MYSMLDSPDERVKYLRGAAIRAAEACQRIVARLVRQVPIEDLLLCADGIQEELDNLAILLGELGPLMATYLPAGEREQLLDMRSAFARGVRDWLDAVDTAQLAYRMARDNGENPLAPSNGLSDPHTFLCRDDDIANTQANGQWIAAQCQLLADKVRHVAFVPNPFQSQILTALAGRALAKQELAAEVCGGEGTRLYKPNGLKELKEEGLVVLKRGLGYYRPDHPPAAQN